MRSPDGHGRQPEIMTRLAETTLPGLPDKIPDWIGCRPPFRGWVGSKPAAGSSRPPRKPSSRKKRNHFHVAKVYEMTTGTNRHDYTWCDALQNYIRLGRHPRVTDEQTRTTIDASYNIIHVFAVNVTGRPMISFKSGIDVCTSKAAL